jgi:hypothetical protein
MASNDAATHGRAAIALRGTALLPPRATNRQSRIWGGVLLAELSSMRSEACIHLRIV